MRKMKRNWILATGGIAGIMIAILVPHIHKVEIARALADAKATMAPVWTVASVSRFTFEGDRKYETGLVVPHGYVRLWIKPANGEKFEGKEAYLIVATGESPQLEQYLKVKPGDQLYFVLDQENPDHLSGWDSFEKLRLWMVVPEEKQKDYPGDFRQHPEYRFQRW